MLRFTCDRCGCELAFDAMRCGGCASPIGYDSGAHRPRALVAVGGGGFETAEHDQVLWRCLNASWGCNWLVTAGGPQVWCASCRLTRSRPDTANPDAVARWSVAESAKRRLVHQLHTMGFPLPERSGQHPDGLTFDLVHVPGEPAVTGHFEGVITLDLTEADELHRTTVRQAFGEPYRTLIGHLRHEMGHFLMADLIAAPGANELFRQHFGDPTADYAGALRRHHDTPNTGWQADGFISAYASAHPLEDWAESFAHYLHITDAVETMHAYRLAALDDSPADTTDPADDAPAADAVGAAGSRWRRDLATWRHTVPALNAITAGLGLAAIYPFELTEPVLAKLDVVDACISGRTAS